eukprot:2779204-Amphidinium_carterae.2
MRVRHISIGLEKHLQTLFSLTVTAAQDKPSRAVLAKHTTLSAHLVHALGNQGAPHILSTEQHSKKAVTPSHTEHACRRVPSEYRQRGAG